MPLVAMGLAKLLRLDPPLGVGLILLGAAAGAPFLPKLTQAARGDVAQSVALMVLLMVVSVIFMPLALPLMLPGAAVNPLKIAQSLVLLMLLPLAAASVARVWLPTAAGRVKPAMDKISSVALLLLVVLITVANIQPVLEIFGTRGILAGLLFIVAGYAVGWLIGGPHAHGRTVLALGTSSRNFAAALVVAEQSFPDPKVTVMIVVVAIASLLILMPVARRRSRFQAPHA
jgi:BASS family bile acid:Na+ symporter